MTVILASQSPQRRAILAQLGIEHVVAPSGVVELTDGNPVDVVVANAVAKARALAKSDKVANQIAAGYTVVGADTEVACDGRLLGKPTDADAAAEFIRSLAGGDHQVYGGLAVVDAAGERTAIAITTVSFRELDEIAIAAYVATGEWQGRAGGYAIQGRGAALVDRIDGDYLNVVGLPVAELVKIAPKLFQ